MQKCMEKLSDYEYPIFKTEIMKTDTEFNTMEKMCDEITRIIKSDPKLTWLCDFDHMKHTIDVVKGPVREDIKAARCLVFCFGISIPNPLVLAARPRSFGVVDVGDKFIISFLAAPREGTNETMTAWIDGLVKK